jgi:PPM family protein phosphatase
MNNSLMTCLSATCKTTPNQDYCCKVENEKAGFKGLIIADGIGSHKMSEIASAFCCKKLKEILEQVATDQIDFDFLYRNIKSELIDFSKSLKHDGDVREWQLGTTLICVLEFKLFYLIAYVGNGSVWHTAGAFAQFPKQIYVPWNSVNLLNPHSIEQMGKPALTNFISVTDAPSTPTIIKLNKTNSIAGEMIILTTDGIFSIDNVSVGKDENGVIWIRGEENMIQLYSYLTDFLRENPKTGGNEFLSFKMGEYLENLKKNGLMHDDTTVGIIISYETIEYYQKIWEQQILAIANEDNKNI